MQAMSDEPRDTTTEAPTRRRDHLRVVEDVPVDLHAGPPPRPRTIGRLIAQTALIADSAVTRRRLEEPDARAGMAGRLLGRFR